jgi:hypothetical protein
MTPLHVFLITLVIAVAVTWRIIRLYPLPIMPMYTIVALWISHIIIILSTEWIVLFAVSLIWYVSTHPIGLFP